MRDLIVRANGEAVTDLASFEKLLADHADDGVRLLVERDGTRRFVFLDRN